MGMEEKEHSGLNLSFDYSPVWIADCVSRLVFLPSSFFLFLFFDDQHLLHCSCPMNSASRQMNSNPHMNSNFFIIFNFKQNKRYPNAYYNSNLLSFMTMMHLQVGFTTHDISTNRLLRPIFSQQKMERLGRLIPNPTTSTSNGRHQLLTHIPQAPCMLGG